MSNGSGKIDNSYIPVLSSLPAPTASLSLNSQNITNLLDPINPQDGATKNYVDTSIQGFQFKTDVLIATTANISLSGTQTVDNVALVVGNRVLVKNQATQSQNGIYIVASGAWTRTTDYATWAEIYSSYVFVQLGTANGGTGWSCTVAAGGTLGTTNITYSQFNSVSSYTGTNVGSGTGNVFYQVNGTQFQFKTILQDTGIIVTNDSTDVKIGVDQTALSFASMTNSGTLTVLKGGTGSTTSTGTAASAVVLADTPTLITPILGVATATSINGLAITTTTSGTLTLANSSSLITSGAFPITLTSSASTNVTLPTSGTLLSTAAAGTGGTTVSQAKTNLGFTTKYAANVGNGSLTTFTLTHNLGTLDVTWALWEVSSGNAELADVVLVDTNNVSVTFTNAPTSNQFRMVISG